MNPHRMKIGELARRSGVGIDTVRYYEREGILPKAQRLASGYRAYDAEDLRRLRFVLRAKSCGFTLAEIRELLALCWRGDEDMAAMRGAAELKLADVEARLHELSRMREALSALVEACPGHGALACCPILNTLTEESAPAGGSCRPLS